MILNEIAHSSVNNSEQIVANEKEADVFFSSTGPFVPQDKKFYELVFINIVTQNKESFFNPEVKSLADKMRQAMKLKNLQVIELDCLLSDRTLLPSKLAQVCESRYVVVYSSFPQNLGELIYKGPGKWIETYSPAYLLEDPNAKKVVWADLQKVMRELGVL